jgi:hypothetical protein
MSDKYDNYSREEKVKYYENKIKAFQAVQRILNKQINNIRDRIAFIQSDKYQDWNSSVSDQLSKK